MLLGMKLDHGYASRPDYDELFSGIEDPLAQIRDLGMGFIEFPIQEDFAEADCRRLVEDNVAAGLVTDFHPYLTGEHNPGAFEDVEGNVCREFVTRTLDVADWTSRAQGASCVLVFHGASNYVTKELPIAEESREFYQRRTTDFFKWIERTVSDRGLEVLVVSELQLPGNEPFFRIGENFEELMLCVEGTDIPLCWDTGHAYLGTLRKGLPEYPSQKFIDRVRHVHLHDVKDNRDHQPIPHGVIPHADYVRSLRDAGYDGHINFELTAAGILATGNFVSVMAECVRSVREAWEEEQ